jgi:hypothetical protein
MFAANVPESAVGQFGGSLATIEGRHKDDPGLVACCGIDGTAIA